MLAPDTVKALEAIRAGHVRAVVPPRSPTTVLADGEGSLLSTAQGTPQDMTPEASSDRLFKAEPNQATCADAEVCAPSTPSDNPGCTLDEASGSEVDVQQFPPALEGRGPQGIVEGAIDGNCALRNDESDGSRDGFQRKQCVGTLVGADSQRTGFSMPQPKASRGAVACPQTPPRTEQIADATRSFCDHWPEPCRQAPGAPVGDASRHATAQELGMWWDSADADRGISLGTGGLGYPGDRGSLGGSSEDSEGRQRSHPSVEAEAEAILEAREATEEAGLEGRESEGWLGDPLGCSAVPPRPDAGAEGDEEERRGTPDLGEPAGSAGARDSISEAGTRWTPQEQEVVEAQCTISSRADILVTDLLDHGVLGLDLLKAVDYAGMRLLKPGARVLPAHVQVCPPPTTERYVVTR